MTVPVALERGQQPFPLSGLLRPEPDIDDFWLRVKTNLAASRIRLLFVSDAIPSELRRIIEFLNNNMDTTEVLGLERRLSSCHCFRCDSHEREQQ